MAPLQYCSLGKTIWRNFMKLKVCHVSSAHTETDIRILLKECISLSDAGFQVKLVIPSSSKQSYFFKDVEIIPLKKFKRFLRIIRGSFEAAFIAWRTESIIYHFHDPELLPYAFIFKVLGKKVIFDFHEDVAADILDKEWIPLFLRQTISSIYETFEKLIARYFDAVIGATPHITEQFNIKKCYAVTINNYPFLKEFEGTVDRSQLNKNFCYIGSINQIRGLIEMIQASKKAQVNLHLAGPISEKDQLLIQSHENIFYKGKLTRGDLKIFLQNSFCGLVLFHPIKNHIEAQPNKLFEYMSAGLPVICSDFPLWKALIEDNQFGFCVDPFDTDQIAEKMIYFIQNPTESIRMGDLGRKAIVEKYNWENEKLFLIQLYQKIAFKD